MNFLMNEDQRAIVDLAAALFVDHCADDQILRFWSGTEPYDRTLWSKLAETGLLGLMLPEEHGGSGLGMIEVIAVLECQGRYLAPAPLWNSQLAAATLARFSSDTAKGRLLQELVSGEKLGTLSLEGLLSSRGLSLHAEKAGGKWSLLGRCPAVPLALESSVALLPAKTADGVRVFVVDLALQGIKKIGGVMTHHEPAADLEFDELSLPAEAVLADDALEWLAPRAAACLGALQLGVAGEALKRAVAYTSERIQFDHPIATFQAISQKAADCLIDVEALRSSLWQLAWRLDAGLESAGAAASVRAWACDTGHRVSHAAQHMHGGMGADTSYPIHRYTLWSRAIEITCGGVSSNLDALGLWLNAAEVEL
ncbi:MAG: acyl-CoA/acyl-ACP dehydrogenase [Betaproteobacteria bacterium]|nr:acyl-CoA/acyl-ACP dehydrogenase [Betaproteobacteria bacterium]